MIVTNKKERTRFLRFMVVGMLGAVVDFGTFNLLTNLTTIKPVIASVISFSAAVTSNFLWNRYWTYPDSRSRKIANQLIMFTIVNVAGLIIRLPILRFLEIPFRNLFTRLSLNLLSPEILGKNFTLAIAIGIVMLWNFFANRLWTYNDID